MSMRVSAEFDDTDAALAAAKALTDEGAIAADDIEIRSAWPLFEEALPPHFHRPMRIRNYVRLMWVFGAIAGFTLVWYCQTDYPVRTSGHAIVPIPINAIITYECAQITALIMTTFFFFIETNLFRMRPIPEEEDLAVGNGQLAIVVGGPNAEAAKPILERGGARAVRTYASVAVAFLMMLSLFTTGCGQLGPSEFLHQVTQFPQVRMRTQTGHGVPGWPLDPNRAWPIKDQENINAGYDPGIVSMPSHKDPDIAQMTEPYGKLLLPAELERQQREHPGRSTPAEVKSFPNPVPNTVAAEERGKVLYEQNCTFCHGAAGHGDGNVASIYAIQPAAVSGKGRPDLLPPGVAPAGQGNTDGDLYWSITVAPPSMVMPAFGSKLAPMDRFYIVRYLRKLQRDAGAAIPPAAQTAEKPAAEGTHGAHGAPAHETPAASPAEEKTGEAPSAEASAPAAETASGEPAESPAAEASAPAAEAPSAAPK